MKDIEIKNEYGKFKFRVSVVIIKDGFILLEKAKKYDGYCFPGGHVELGETTLESVVRECQEELQINVKKATLLSVLENIYFSKNSFTVQELNYFYKVNADITIDDKLFEVFEIDKGIEKKHVFEWVFLENLKDICLQPLAIRDLLMDKKVKKVLLVDNR